MAINIQQPCFVPRVLHTDHPYVQYKKYEMLNFAANLFHIPTPAAQNLASFVASQTKYLIVDPRTPIYQFGGHAGKPTYSQVQYAIQGNRILGSQDFNSQFTLQYTHQVLAEQRQHHTTVVVPPYFHFGDVTDPWFQVNTACVAEAHSRRLPDENILVFVLFDCSLLLRPQAVAATAQALAKTPADGYYLLAADLEPLNLTNSIVRGYQDLVQRLTTTGRPVIPAQAGKLSLALIASGASGYAMGFGKLDSIRLETFRQGGTGAGQPNRYYFHNLLLPIYTRNADDVANAQATSPAYPCSCSHCNGNPPSQVRSKERVFHYIDFRVQELSALQGMNPQQATQHLRTLFSDAFNLAIMTHQELRQSQPFSTNALPTSEFAHLDVIAQCL